MVNDDLFDMMYSDPADLDNDIELSSENSNEYNNEKYYEDPDEVIAEIQDRLKSSKNNAYDLSDDYDTLGEIILDSDNNSSLDSAFYTFMEAMKSAENDEFSLAHAYGNLNNVADTIASDRPDWADQAITAIKESLNSQKDDTNLEDLAYEAIDSIENSKPDPNATINKFQKSSVKYESQLVDVYRAFSDISRNKPELLDSKFGIFMEALKSPKNGTISLPVASETLDNILKAKPELDGPLLAPIKVILRTMKHFNKSPKMMNFGCTVANAVNHGGLIISKDRIESEHALSDCCKAWKICPAMPRNLAGYVGKSNLKGRMLAGAIFDKMTQDKQTTPQEWRQNKDLQKQFYNNLESAEKMPLEAAFKQYIPDNSVNRGRTIRCLMNEKGIEATSKNFETYYNQALENGTFEKLLEQTENKKTKQPDELSQVSAIKTQDKSRNN